MLHQSKAPFSLVNWGFVTLLHLFAPIAEARPVFGTFQQLKSVEVPPAPHRFRVSPIQRKAG